MNEQQIRAALAEAFPAVFPKPTGAILWNWTYKRSDGRVLPCIDGDPLRDLNAMHEAECELDSPQSVAFATELKRVTMFNDSFYWNFYFCNATAPQRAEAILRAKGLLRE
jgi:hypothetical protein